LNEWLPVIAFSVLLLVPVGFQNAYGIIIDNFDEGDVLISLGPDFEFSQVDETGLTGVIGGSRTAGMTHESGTSSLLTINNNPTLGQLSFNADSGGDARASLIYNADNSNELNLDLRNEDGIRVTIDELTTRVRIEISFVQTGDLGGMNFMQAVLPTSGPFVIEALLEDFNSFDSFDLSDVGGMSFSLSISDAESGIIIESIETFRQNGQPVGGEIIPIDTTSLILAGAQSFSWMIPVVLSVLGIGLFVFRKRIN